MTKRHHAGDDREQPDLNDVIGDVDPADPEQADELLEGLLGAQANERDDIPKQNTVDEPDSDSQSEPNETVSGRWACRFCATERRKPDSLERHLDGCADYHKHVNEQQTQNNNDETAKPPTPDAGGDSPDDQRTYLIDTQWHEFRAYLKYAKHGHKPIYALHNLYKQSTFGPDGGPKREIEHRDRKYQIEFTYQDSNLKPWNDESWNIENVKEYRLHLETSDGLRKADFLIRPRWPDMKSLHDGPNPSNPRDFIGIDVDTQGANHNPDEYPELLDKAMTAFGVNGSSGTTQTRYLQPENVEPWSIIIDGELYVRVNDDYAGRLIGMTGPLERLNLVMAADRNGYRKRVADDREEAGHYHTCTLGSERFRHLFNHHNLGKEIKVYKLKNPDAVDDDDPLSNPKLGVSYQRSISDTRVYWNRDDLEFDKQADQDAIGLNDMAVELDETLLNTLRWANLPTRPDRQIFIEDAIFNVELRRRERTLKPDPLPTIEQEQEHIVTRALNSMTNINQSDVDARLINELVADGGEKSPKSLSKSLGVHYETVLRSLDRIGPAIEHNYGEVQIKSRHIAQQLAERAGNLLENFGHLSNQIDALGQQVANVADGLETEQNPFQMWAEQYLSSIEDPDDDIHLYLRMDYRPEDLSEARKILKQGLTALRTTIGAEAADAAKIARRGKATLNLADGTPANLPFGTP